MARRAEHLDGDGQMPAYGLLSRDHFSGDQPLLSLW